MVMHVSVRICTSRQALLSRGSIPLEQSPTFRLFRLHGLATIALAQPAKQRIGIDAGIMSIAPGELQGVTSDWLDILQHDQQWHVVWLEATFPCPFIYAGGTGALLSEMTDRIDPLVAITPLDGQHPFFDPFHVTGFKDCRSHASGIPFNWLWGRSMCAEIA